MIQELVDFGKQVTKGKSKALKEEHFSITLVIDNKGSFQRFIVSERQFVESEAITAKKGKARFLLDKCEEVLGVTIDFDKLESFKKNLEPYKKVKVLEPVFKFYNKLNRNGLKKAIVKYMYLDKDLKCSTFTFMVDSTLLLANEEIKCAINKHIHEKNETKDKDGEYTAILRINKEGEFQNFIFSNSQSVQTESVITNKKESLLLLGKSDEILGITEDGIGKKHQLFLNKLEQYKKDLPSIGPILKFYEKDFKNGLTKAIAESIFQLNNNAIKDNITFLVMGEPLLIKTNEVRTAIINHFVENEKNLSNGKVCSICGKTDSPVLDEPHGLVKIPKGQAAGCALISYNEPAFESYNLKGNLNSSICRDCARNYIEALKFLLSDGHPVVQKDKQKVYYEYNHRINLSDTTVVLFWTKHGKASISPFVISNPPDNLWIKGFFNSIWNGEKKKISTIDSNMFYCCTLSSAAARIAVRDWTSISLDEYKNNLAEWFRDIEIENREGEIIYSPLKLLINATQHDKKTGEKNKADTNSKTRMGSILWNSAIKGKSHMIPLEVLQYILNRIWKGDEFSTSRAAVIKLVINRNTNKKMKSTIEETNTSIAYLCGRLFAIIESMQWKAIGNVNNGVKERFFAAAAIQPAAIFGTLLTKNIPIYQHKIGGYLAKELNDIMSSISERGRIPLRFSTIEQGEFALGYYFQRNHKTNKETLNK